MSTSSIGEQHIFDGWCVSREIGETHIIFAKGKLRTLYDCRTDKIIGEAIQSKETWDPQQKPKIVNPKEMGGLEKIASFFKVKEMGGLEKILVNS